MGNIRLKTMKDIMRIQDELYGKTGKRSPLKQVVPDKYYQRGDHTHIMCLRCGSKLKPEERNHYSGKCTKCEEYLATIPYPKDNASEHYARMAKGMVLANSCNYDRWS